ncbi:hypothetical protein PFZ55_57005, partial [Streptomyces sp. MS2A]|nr:hypothetical protein [Streptomyces sp. MS2A]
WNEGRKIEAIITRLTAKIDNLERYILFNTAIPPSHHFFHIRHDESVQERCKIKQRLLSKAPALW